MPHYPIEKAAAIVAAGLPIGPRLYPCVCGAGRHAHRGNGKRPAPGCTGACPATGCGRYRPSIAWQMAYEALDAQATPLGKALREADKRERAVHYKDNPRKPGEWSIGASDTTTCPRKIQYRNAPPEDFVPDPEDGRPALAGTMLHEGITRRLKALYPWRLFGGKVRIAGLDRDSEFDSFDPITGEVEDYKSAGNWKWDSLADDGPDDDTWGQVALYGLALEDEGYTVRTLRLSYYKRENGHSEPHVRPYERAFAEKYRDRLLGYATSLDVGLDLPKTESGPTTSGLCRSCFARSHCWSIPQAEKAGRSPESYTVLGANPVDETVVWAIQQKVEAAAARLAAAKAEDASKVLLEGIEPGRYGAFEGYTQWGGGGVDYQAWADRLATYYAMPEDTRPALEDIGQPQKARYSFVKWGKVRKATLDREKKDAAALDKGDQP